MKTVINEYVFDFKDNQFIDFFNKHGWVVVNNIFPKNKINSLHTQYEAMKNEYANESRINITDYENEITQWRNLWLRGDMFKEAIFDKNGIHSVVQKSMQWSGIKLFHDHIITKPPQTSTSIIPWHQDSMFWPIDRVGCSALMALTDIKIESGCLEVIDYSHLNKCDSPKDFMATEKNDFSEDSIRVLLPINAGSTILMHSLCWHRSSANKTTIDRPMHISLWMNTSACWRPNLVDWHPVNQYVESQPNEILTGKMFPSFGTQEKTNSPAQDIHTGTATKDNEISMFNATKIINNQLLVLLNMQNESVSLGQVLADEENRRTIILQIANNHIHSDKKVLNDLLNRLWICSYSYEKNHSRNVFNTVYVEWWDMVGQKLETKLKYIEAQNND